MTTPTLTCEQIIGRKEAKALGLKRYFTGKACRRGHRSEQLVSGGGCLECKQQYERERWTDPVKRKQSYQRQKQKISARQRTDEFRKKRRELYARNRKRQLLNSKRWSDKNKILIAQKAKAQRDKLNDLIAVLRDEKPDLLKEFGL